MAKCCTPTFLGHWVKVVALISLLMGIGIFGLSSWILHKSLQMKKNHEINSKEFLVQANTFFGGTDSKNGPSLFDYDIIFRILISTSCAALIGGGLQLILSLALFLTTIKGGSGNRIVEKLWVYTHAIIMLVIGSATLCLLTNELEINMSMRIFLIASGTDALALIVFMWVVYSWSFEDSEDTLKNTPVVYHRNRQNPPGYNTSVLAPLNGSTNMTNDTTPGFKGVENFRDVKLRPVSAV